MFGWEFPPNITGGLGTACLGITKALSAYPDLELTFVVPKVYGDEPANGMKLIGANEIDLITSKINVEKLCGPFTYLSITSGLVPYLDPEEFKKICTGHETTKTTTTEDISPVSIEFTGKYGPDLMTEIHNFSIIAEYIAKQGDYDVIHAHDWLTFPAGILAKGITGKPLVVHVHATDFDRSGGSVNPTVFKMEKAGMEAADAVITVSNFTAQRVQYDYSIDPSKIFTVHNGAIPLQISNPQKLPPHKKKHTVSFLGRVSVQKGPEFFVEVAQKVLSKMDNVEFVMAGSGDMLGRVKKKVVQLGLTKKFRFPGFICGNDVEQLMNRTDVYIMPSISEPFGIAPLEAMQYKVPVIISKQSGVSEVVQHAIKLDFWDTDAMADAVYSILKRPALKGMMKEKGSDEVRNISWEKSANKIARIYNMFAGNKILMG